MSYSAVLKELRALGDPERARHSLRFFKTGEGEYGEGDLTVPLQRKVVRKFRDLPLDDVQKLLDNPYHECRLTGLLILVDQYKRHPVQKYVSFYLKNRARVNNWDLVDSSAHYILGNYLLERDRKTLYKLSRSKSPWDRRIAVVSCFAFIAEGDFDDALALCEQLLGDTEDLMHKACGWVLREVGKKDEKILCGFLDTHCTVMPRTMLRYSLERLSPVKKKKYMGR